MAFRGLTVRGDAHSCPLAFGLDTYYNCVYDCAYCSFVGLPATFGKGEHRQLDISWFSGKIANGVLSKNPRSPLAKAIASRKTLRFGNKYDPFPPQEEELKISAQALYVLKAHDWEVKIETKNPPPLGEINLPRRSIITTTITVGMDDDWNLFERRLTPSPSERLRRLGEYAAEGYQVAVTTEPFIPGYHEIKQFFDLVELAQSLGINRFNAYNLQLTPFNVKRLIELGLDMERIWDFSQDELWKPILQELLSIDAIVGCPDFANAGGFVPGANTCCGVDVENPCTFNSVNWRRIAMLEGEVTWDDFRGSWDGVGDYSLGVALFTGEAGGYYTLADTGVLVRKDDGWTTGTSRK